MLALSSCAAKAYDPYAPPKTKLSVGIVTVKGAKPISFARVGEVFFVRLEPMFVRQRLNAEITFGNDREPRIPKVTILESREYLIAIRFSVDDWWHYKLQHDPFRDLIDASRSSIYEDHYQLDPSDPKISISVRLRADDGKIIATGKAYVFLMCPMCVS